MADTPQSSTVPATIENVGKGIDDQTLAEIRSFDDALRQAEATGELENYSDYGTGFVVLPTAEKNRLVGVPFVILEWRFTNGDNGLFVSCAIVTKNGEKLIVNDGSTGIRDQLVKITEQRKAKGRTEPQKSLIVERGLTESRYEYPDPKTGEMRPAVTYYLSN